MADKNLLDPGVYRVSKWTAQFLAEDVEHDYQQQRFLKDQKYCLVVGVVFSILWFLGIVLDYLTIFPVSSDAFILLLPIRIFTGLLCAYGALLVSRANSHRLFNQCFLAGLFFASISYNWVASQYAGVLGISMSGTVYVAAAVFVMILLPLPLLVTSMGAVIVLTMTIISKIWLMQSPANEIFILVMTMLLAISVSGTLANFLQRSWRVEYGDRIRLEAANMTLQREISLRKKVEKKLKTYHEELETLVADRTQQLRETEHSLQSVQRLESIGLLAGGIAHDFNNSLGVILGLVDLALDDEAEKTLAKKRYKMMKSSVLRAAELVRQLLAFSRRQVIEFEPVDVNELIRNDNMLISRVIPENISLHLDLEPNIKTILADTGQLEQVLMNLTLNARDAMVNGGMLVIQTHNEWVSEKMILRHPDAREGQHICLSVRDTGTGMTNGVQDHIFEPFFTTKPIGKGTGLGLSVVIGIVQQHGGFVDIRSQFGEGTSISVHIPVHDAHVTVSPSPEDVVKTQGVGSELVMVVEDDPNILEVTSSVLVKWGYKVLTAGDGVQALYLYEQHRDEIDLVLLDIVMPNMGGREVMETIRETNPGQKILFATGHAPDGVHTSFVTEEDLPLIEKPYTNESLLMAVRSTLDIKNEASTHSD